MWSQESKMPKELILSVGIKSGKKSSLSDWKHEVETIETQVFVYRPMVPTILKL